MESDPDLTLRRKWTFRAHGRQVLFVKKPRERTSHVLMKAFLWALYLPRYPDLAVEVPVGSRFKPDVVQTAPGGDPLFWGEAGHVGNAKVKALVRRYRETHFALARWSTCLAPVEALVRRATKGVERAAPFDLISFPGDSAEQFIRPDGEITVGFEDLAFVRVE